MAGVDPPGPPGARRALALLGVAAALWSLAFPYATLSLGGRTISVVATLDPRTPLLALPVLVVVGAALAAVDHTRGEQLLGALFAAVLLATVLGPLVVVDLLGWPGPGLWLLLAAWVLVDAADDLDPALANPRARRWQPLAASRLVPLAGLAVVLVVGGTFLWVHRAAVTGGWTTPRSVAWVLTATAATAAWVAVAAWERTAVRG